MIEPIQSTAIVCVSINSVQSLKIHWIKLRSMNTLMTSTMALM